MSFKLKYLGQERTFDSKVRLLDLIKDQDPNHEYICARVNNRVRELNFEIYFDAEIDFLTVKDPDAVRVYEATLRFIFSMAWNRIYPELKFRLAYNVSRCISVHILTKGHHADKAMMDKVKAEMDKIIKEDLPITRLVMSNAEAAEFYKEKGFDDKLAILPFRPEKTVHLNKAGEYIDYMYQHMAPSTAYITDYEIKLYNPGLLIRYPRAEEGGKIPEYEDSPTFARTLYDAHHWGRIVGAASVAGINSQIQDLGTIEFINLCEAKHNRMLCELGQMIENDIDNIRLICIAGPSSSGKTTFANRLRIELLSRGIHPIRISLDDYYKPKGETPLDEDGKPDYETINALDIEHFASDMVALINGETVTLPRFDFQLGHAVPGRTLSIGEHEPLIIEGIHALNEILTRDIPKNAKFKIFIAPQSQMNLDDHNPVSLTDLRLIRRIVRDHKYRNSSAEETMSMWPSVRRGEFKWIYKTQEGCDYVYNSYLPYELPVMKKYALPLLMKIERDSEFYPTASRLKHMLKFFVDMDDQWIPSNSLIREFIGGSCYKDV